MRNKLCWNALPALLLSMTGVRGEGEDVRRAHVTLNLKM